MSGGAYNKPSRHHKSQKTFRAIDACPKCLAIHCLLHIPQVEFAVAKDFGHAPAASKVLSVRAYEKPTSHYKIRKTFPKIGACPRSFATILQKLMTRVGLGVLDSMLGPTSFPDA